MQQSIDKPYENYMHRTCVGNFCKEISENAETFVFNSGKIVIRHLPLHKTRQELVCLHRKQHYPVKPFYRLEK